LLILSEWTLTLAIVNHFSGIHSLEQFETDS